MYRQKSGPACISGRCLLVDLFLFGLLAFWGVTLNVFTMINIVMALGLAVDYSAHIGHAYLTIKAPEE